MLPEAGEGATLGRMEEGLPGQDTAVAKVHRWETLGALGATREQVGREERRE
jgi:hypothetical protein